MARLATATMSPTGQIVIPQAIRKRLKLKPGSRFVVMGERDAVILKAISSPSMDQFDDLLAQARRQARRAGLKRADITAAIAAVRARR